MYYDEMFKIIKYHCTKKLDKKIKTNQINKII